MNAAAPPRLLFICIENACRSQMAQGFAGAADGGAVRAWSAGSRPGSEVNPTAVRLMAELGIDLEHRQPKSLDDLPEGVTWDYVISMGCGDVCPDLSARRRLDWDLPDPRDLPDDEFRQVRDEIGRRVAQLLRELCKA